MLMSRTIKALVGSAVLGVAVSGAGADVLYSQDFETNVESKLRTLDGWSHGDERVYIKTEATHGWAGQSGDAAAMAFAYNQRVTAPSVDTSAHDTVRVGLDFRPADASAGRWGVVLRGYVRNQTTNAVGEAFYVMLSASTQGAGTVVRTHGNNGANAQTTIPWQYDQNAVNSIMFVIDQVNRRYGFIFDNGTDSYTETDLRWVDLGYGGPEGTFEYLQIQAGSGGATQEANKAGWLAFDNYYVTDGSPIPEPASLALLGMSGLLALRRRRA